MKNDLALVPQEKRLVVLMTHLPVTEMENRTELFRLVEKRPVSLSISGRAHWQAHQFIDPGDGWQGEKPHRHVVNVTVCGTWWRGEKDERGIPHATMRDGAPNGYSIMTFDGTSHILDFKAAREPADCQFRIHAPNEIADDEAENHLNARIHSDHLWKAFLPAGIAARTHPIQGSSPTCRGSIPSSTPPRSSPAWVGSTR